ncbi:MULTISPECIES: ComEA family DNA-binding protein [unclassified Spirillospora]|uniref:ComEA family DNA-binding protein n=1 Tax=unclassified Spirillospora TaxID=2642701 RepID=UPI0037166E03
MFVLANLSSILIGTTHALVIRRRIFPASARPDPLEQAEREARHRRDLRARAADIARNSPQTAWEMRIGRPDLPRNVDDGGLVDINHAPASARMTIPHMTPDLAERIVRLRDDVGGFGSAEEVAALAQLPPTLTPHLPEHAVFLR